MPDVVKINSYLVTDGEGEAFDDFWGRMAPVRASSSPATARAARAWS